MGVRTIGEDERKYNHKFLVGFGILSLLAVMALTASMILAYRQELNSARYPNSVQISNHTNYTGLPAHIRWYDSYLTRDDFTTVYNWYSITFDMGAEARANSNCIVLESSATRIATERQMSVILCSTSNGQMIYVSRHTSLKLSD